MEGFILGLIKSEVLQTTVEKSNPGLTWLCWDWLIFDGLITGGQREVALFYLGCQRKMQVYSGPGLYLQLDKYSKTT